MLKYMGCWVMVIGLLPGHLFGEEGYHWPMQAPPALTSTFGEYRGGGRLHAAIDLKTWGKEGYPVVSVSDGYVWRVRTSPWGYGRAVYVRLKDGRVGIWAHLSGFSERIEKYVMEEQDRRGTYSVNLFFSEHQLPVKRGEVIGFSGSTGIGPPHMHFELRDAQNRPLNPLLHGFDVEDTLPPTMRAIAFVPQDAHARINGTPAPVVATLRWQAGQNRYVYPDTVVLWGCVGVALDAFDTVDASALENRVAPYRLWLHAGEREVFATRYAMFGYDVTSHGELDRNFLLSRRGFGRFHNLYLEAGNQLPLYGAYRAGDGVLHAGVAAPGRGYALPPGVHELRIASDDVKGNRSEAVVAVRVAQAPQIAAVQAAYLDAAVNVEVRVAHAQRALFERSDDGGKTWQALGPWQVVHDQRVQRTLPNGEGAVFRARVENGDDASATWAFAPPKADPMALSCDVAFFPAWAIVRIRADRVPPDGPSVVARYANGQETTLSVQKTGWLQYQTVVLFDAQADGDVALAVRAGEASASLVLPKKAITRELGGEIVSENGQVRVRFGRNGVRQALFGRVETHPVADARMVGSAHRVMPDDVAFEPAELTFVYPEGVARPGQIGIYALRGNAWGFVDNTYDAARGVLRAEVKNLGVFALRIDDVPPVISEVRPRPGSELADRQPLVQATVRDTMSGIWREEDIEMALNGQRLIVEYHPDKNLLMARPRQPLVPGEHHLLVRVRDVSGNEARQTSTFTVR